MYDMYPWDSASQGDYPPEPLRSWRNSSPATPRETSPAQPSRAPQPSRAAQPGRAPQPSRAAQAVQVALDRRDNGGDAAAPPAAGAHPAPPTASRTRQ